MIDKIINVLKKMDELTYSRKQSTKSAQITLNNDEWTEQDELNFQQSQKMFEQLEILRQNYDSYIAKHYELLEKIGFKYTIAINQNSIFNTETEKCIELCRTDIALAPILKEYFEKDSIIRGHDRGLPSYPSFKTLAMIYEKQEDYYDAIKICISAIILGFLRDGTTGGMQGRLAKLIKKYNKMTNSHVQFDYTKNILFNEETGEVFE